MARQVPDRDISATLAAAERWINTCLIEDKSLFSDAPLWTAALVEEEHHAFVEHPDLTKADFITKLKGQIRGAAVPAQRLMAEMLWALLLFPSNVTARRKRQQVEEIWSLSGHTLDGNHPLLRDEVLTGIGSGGPGFNNYRPDELTFLIALARDLKRKALPERREVFANYDAFAGWIQSVPQQGFRQFRHMLRFFAFPDRVERMSSNNDRRKILEGFGIAAQRDTRKWSDVELDDALSTLRADLATSRPSGILDFYEPDLRARWSPSRSIKTLDGEVIVAVPRDEDEEGGTGVLSNEKKAPDARQSIQIQAKLAEIGKIMGFKIWLPRSDRGRVRELTPSDFHSEFIDELPLNYDDTTLETIEQIDVLWLKRRSIVRAFEVEHTTAVYSGLLRMADLLALQPNMDIQLHIVAPDERREKVFREMLRPVFSLLDRGPLSNSCTFISYESVEAIRGLEHLAHTNDSIIAEYEEKADT